MFDFIDKLRKKSPATKKMIALTVSASVTGIIFFFWLSSFWFSSTLNDSKKDSFSEIITPLASVKENLAEVYSSFEKLLNIGKNK